MSDFIWNMVHNRDMRYVHGYGFRYVFSRMHGDSQHPWNAAIDSCRVDEITDSVRVIGNGFTLSSSKGDCGVSGGTLSCGSGVSASTFTVRSTAIIYAFVNLQTNETNSKTNSGIG